MAQYFRDFSEYATGLNPPGWTLRWATTNTFWDVQRPTGTIGDSWLAHSNTDTGDRFHLFGWDEEEGPEWPADIEVLTRFNTAAAPSGYDGGIMVRASGTESSKNGIFFVLEDGNWPVIYMYENNQEIWKTEGFWQYFADEWIWLRFRVIGDQFQAKYWRGAFENEPTDWLLETSDTRVPNSGWTGFFVHRPEGDRFFDIIGVGTNGDTAPHEPVEPPTDIDLQGGIQAQSELDGLLVSDAPVVHELEGEVSADSSLEADLFVDTPDHHALEGEIAAESTLRSNLRVPLAAEDREIHARIVFLRNPEIDVTPWVTRAEVNLGNVSSVGTGSSGGDGVVRQAFITLQNDNDNRFSPLDTLSNWNYDGATFDPLLKPNREVQIYVAAVLAGESPAPEDYELIFHGLVGDAVRTEGQIVEIECRDLAKRLQDRYILERREYGAPIEDGGVPVEDVMQQILDDEFGVGEIELDVPASPGFGLPPFAVEFGTVWDWLQNITKEFGWFLGYKYDSGTESFRLTLLEPPRAKSAATADWNFEWTEDIYIHDLDITDRDIRNRVAVVYRDEAGQRQTVTVNDAASQDEFGLRPMQIDETDTELIKTAADALNLANFALNDLSGQRATNSLTLPLIPRMDVYDGITVDDPRVSTLEEFYGVESIRHTLDFDGETLQTEVIGAGRVIGAHQRWLQMQAREGSQGNPPDNVWPVRPNTVLTIAAADSNQEGRRRADIVCQGEHDQRDINRALQRVGARGKVVLLEGTFNIDESIIVPSSRILEGQGQSTVIFLDAVVNDFFWMIQNEDLVNGNPNIAVLNLRLDGNAPAHTQDEEWWHYGVYLERCEEAIIQGLNIVDMVGFGVYLLWSDRAKIIQNEIKRCKEGGIFYGGDSDEFARSATISNSIITDCVTDLFWIGNASTGIGAGWAENIVISNNVTANNDQGISIVFIEESTISGNTVNRNIFPGLWVWQQSDNNVITGNNCAYNGLSGIYVQGDDNIVSNNESIGSGQFPYAPAPPGYNIQIDGNRNNVQGNTVRIGEDGEFEPVGGIFISSLSEDTFVTNNDLLDGGAEGNLLEDEGTNTETRPGNRPSVDPAPIAEILNPREYFTNWEQYPMYQVPRDWRGYTFPDAHIQVWFVNDPFVLGQKVLEWEQMNFTNYFTIAPYWSPACHECEMIAEFRTTTTPTHDYFNLFGKVSSRDTNDHSGIAVGFNGSSIVLFRHRTNSRTPIDSQSGLISANTWYRVRVQMERGSQKTFTNMRGRVWPTGDAEPGTWQVEVTDRSDIEGVGIIALGNFSDSGIRYVRQFGYQVPPMGDPLTFVDY